MLDRFRLLSSLVTPSSLVTLLLLSVPAVAQDAADSSGASSATVGDAADAPAPEAAAEGDEESAWRQGPARVELGDSLAEMDLAEGFSFAGADTTRAMMEMMGNPTDGSEIGMIVPSDEESNWLIVFEYSDVGYVEDEDSDEIDADALLTSIRDATEAANEYRREHGGGELHVTEWQIPPFYDPESQNLTWALNAVDEAGAEIVNYNVRLLGRGGYTSVTLVTDSDLLEDHRPEIESVLASFEYTEGRRYADYVSGDKLAGYGLAALVAGGAGAAAAKLGLFAVIGKFLGKAWKLLVVALIAVGSFVRRLFGGRSTADAPQA